MSAVIAATFAAGKVGPSPNRTLTPSPRGRVGAEQVVEQLGDGPRAGPGERAVPRHSRRRNTSSTTVTTSTAQIDPSA